MPSSRAPLSCPEPPLSARPPETPPEPSPTAQPRHKPHRTKAQLAFINRIPTTSGRSSEPLFAWHEHSRNTCMIAFLPLILSFTGRNRQNRKMGWPKCNSTLENAVLDEIPIWHDWTFHHIGLWISAITGIIAIALSFSLIMMHATHYLKPWEQRHIIRILLMVPIYAAVSFLSFYFYLHTVYYEVIRDCYEAFAIASFFALLCHYLAPNLHEQKIYFRGVTPRNWVWPLPYFQKCTGGENKGILRRPRSGLTMFNVSSARPSVNCD